MSFLKHGPSVENSAYAYRWPFLVNVAASGSGPFEATVDLPERFAFLWDGIQDTTNGYDIVPVNANGTTVPTFDLNTSAGSIAAGITAEDVNIRLSGLSYTSSTIDCGVGWVQWNRSSAPNRAGSPTTSSPKSSTFNVLEPAHDEVVIPYDADRIPGPYRKDPDESIRLWFDVTPLLMLRVHKQQSSRAGSGVEAIFFEVTNAGTADGAMKDATSHAYIVDGKGRHLIGCLVLGGTTANNYLAELKVHFTDGRVRKLVAEVDVKTRVES